MPTFGDRIKALRMESKLSLRQLAELTGVSHSSLSSYEIGRREPSNISLEALSRFFDVKIDYLLGKSDDRRSLKKARQYNKMVLSAVENYRSARGLTKEEIEDRLDWEGFYEDMESGDYLGDEGLYATVVGMLGFFDDADDLIRSLNVPEARPVHRKRLQMLGNVACGEPIFAEAEQDSMIDADTDADFCLTAKGDSMINARIFDGDLLFVKQCDIVDDGEIAVVLIGDEATVKRFYYDRENNVVTLMPENPLYKPMRYVGADLDTIRVLGRVVAGQYKL